MAFRNNNRIHDNAAATYRSWVCVDRHNTKWGFDLSQCSEVVISLSVFNVHSSGHYRCSSHVHEEWCRECCGNWLCHMIYSYGVRARLWQSPLVCVGLIKGISSNSCFDQCYVSKQPHSWSSFKCLRASLSWCLNCLNLSLRVDNN